MGSRACAHNQPGAGVASRFPLSKPYSDFNYIAVAPMMDWTGISQKAKHNQHLSRLALMPYQMITICLPTFSARISFRRQRPGSRLRSEVSRKHTDERETC
jgi:hypothetical protein